MQIGWRWCCRRPLWSPHVCYRHQAAHSPTLTPRTLKSQIQIQIQTRHSLFLPSKLSSSKYKYKQLRKNKAGVRFLSGIATNLLRWVLRYLDFYCPIFKNFYLEGISVLAVSDNMVLVSKILKRCHIVSCFDQILSLVNCLRTLRRLKGRATAVHNESIPHHCNFDKGAELLAKFWVVRTGIKILPTGFLCHPPGKKPSSGWCPAAPNGGRETRSQYWFGKKEKWEILGITERMWKNMENIAEISQALLDL